MNPSLMFYRFHVLNKVGISISTTSHVTLLTPAAMFHQDVLEGGNLRAPLQELHQMIITPIKAFSGSEEASPQRTLLSPEGKSAAPGSHLSSSGGVEAESGTSVIAEGDLTGQFTRVMGKGELHRPGLRCKLVLLPLSDFSHLCSSSVCTQLLVSRSDEDNISSYLQLIEKCLNHEVSFYMIHI